MAGSKVGIGRRAIIVTVAWTAMLVGGWPGEASASITQVSGGAFGYRTFVGLFGGPPELRGPAGTTACDGTTTTACSPSVTLPAAGSTTPFIASDPDGATAQYGPAVIHESVSETVRTEGTTGASGSVTSSALVTYNADQEQQVDPFNADRARSECTATEAGQSGSTTLTNASLVLSTDPETQEPVDVIPLPTNPAPNTEYEGTIDHVGDRFRIVLNEQLRTPDAITVNAFHMYLLGEVAVGELILGQSRCGLSATSANEPPVAGDDAYTTAPGTPLTVGGSGVLANDIDPTGDALAASKPAAEPVPTSPSVNCSGQGPCAEPIFFPTEPDNGSVIVDIDGSFTYTPNPGFIGTDTFTYVASDPRGGTDTGVATITVTPPVVSVGDVAVHEGDKSTRAAVFTVSLARPAAAAIDVGYATSNGTATAPGDYTAKSGTASFAPGATSAKVKVAVRGDFGDESNEAFTLTITSPTGGAIIGDGTGTATIIDDDPATVSGRRVAIGDVRVHEGDAGARTALFSVSLSKASTSYVTVSYATAKGSAVGTDFTAKSGSLSFAPGATSLTVKVPITADELAEADESFTVNLSAASGAVIADAVGLGTIIDDD